MSEYKKKELFETVNIGVYNKMYKTYISNKYGKCDRGPWHHRCDRKRPDNSWKRHRLTQYRTKVSGKL